MFLKNRNINSKIKRSKVTDYAALMQTLGRIVNEYDREMEQSQDYVVVEA